MLDCFLVIEHAALQKATKTALCIRKHAQCLTLKVYLPIAITSYPADGILCLGHTPPWTTQVLPTPLPIHIHTSIMAPSPTTSSTFDQLHSTRVAAMPVSLPTRLGEEIKNQKKKIVLPPRMEVADAQEEKFTIFQRRMRFSLADLERMRSP